MPVRIKIDEDLPHEFGTQMRSAGFEAATVTEQGLSGTPDGALWKVVQSEHRWLLTADKGFADIRSFPPGTHAGIVLFRLPRESRAGYLQLLASLMGRLDLSEHAGGIVVVTPDAIRIHTGKQ